MTTFWETMLLLSNIKRQDSVKLFFCAKYGLDPKRETESKLFQSRNRNCNKSLLGTVPDAVQNGTVRSVAYLVVGIVLGTVPYLSENQNFD
jgi:hypothetical protein